MDHPLKQEALKLAEDKGISYRKAILQIQSDRQKATPEYRLLQTLTALVDEFGEADTQRAITLIIRMKDAEK